jgi:hypothetical protein
MSESCRITWYPPLTSVTGTESTLDFDEPMAVSDLLERLLTDFPDLGKFTHVERDTGIVAGLMVLRGDALLMPGDIVEPGGKLEILPAIDGG